MSQGFWAGLQGGVIGTLVAISLNSMFWWVGLIIGLVVGWLAYDWQEVVEATKSVLADWGSRNIYWSDFLDKLQETVSFFSRVVGNLLYFLVLFLTASATILLVFYPSSIMANKPLLSYIFDENPDRFIRYILPVILLLVGALISLLGTRIFLEQKIMDVKTFNIWAEDPENLPNNYAEATWSKKLVVCLRLILILQKYMTATIIGWILGIFLLLRLLFRLICRVLTMIFSEERNAAGFGATIGVLVGYATHFLQPLILSVILGGIIGGLISVILCRLLLIYKIRVLGRIW
ncbi:MAG: hypothetical protein M1338_03445 [Patescibacteria group bacterium]|nr:hypothetical protein [Patescibacteria group bacterium]